MRETTPHPSVQQVERAFLRKAGWLFPVGGALAALAFGGPFWAWVEGQPSTVSWANLLSLRALAGALAGAAIPVVWWLGMRLKRPGRWVALLALGAVVAAEATLRTPLVQAALWLAARPRLDPGQHFMREVCYVRLEEAVGREASAPAVVLVGSSQMLHGVDDRKLRELLNPTPVIRRAMFGLTPLKALAMRTYLPFRPGDVCVWYLSELDFTNQDEFPFAWFRPYASWRTLPEVVGCMPNAVRIRHWRQLADYALAATAESWRARDFLGRIACRFTGRGPVGTAAAVQSEAAAMAERARGELHFSESEWNAFRRFAAQAAARQVELVVFEGDVAPPLQSGARAQAKADVRQLVSGVVASGSGRYVSLAEQGLALTDGDWHDLTHLNAAGREKLTRRIAQELARP
ncbi:MAG: hypothetical protein AB7V22_04395 [Kiritimatiellia bacterium]